MRKCFLCGSLIRRRAEFCRYCTVRQPGSRAGQPNGAPRSAAPTDADPLVWPDPPERRATPAPIEGLQWRPEPEAGPLRPAPEPVDQPRATEARAPERPEPVVTRALPAPPEPPKAEEPETKQPTAEAPKAEDPKADKPEAVRRHDEAETERVIVETTSVTSHLRANGENGSHPSGRSGGGAEDDDPVNGKAKTNGKKPATEPSPSEHLGGFAHFPDAGAKPKVRWR